MADNNVIQNVDIIGFFLIWGNTATDATIKGVLSGSLSLEEAAKLLGITTAILLARIENTTGKRARCKPCDPPVGTRMEEKRDTYRHNGMCPHYHIHTVHQSPPHAGCRCFAPKEEAVAISQGYPEYEAPRGGGVILFNLCRLDIHTITMRKFRLVISLL